jgi:DNA-directed RNA polymerase specialized sigma24 family protein
MVDDATVERLVLAATRGDGSAWIGLWQILDAWLSTTVSNPRFSGRVGQREDDRRNIVLEVMSRLQAHGFERLKLYVEAKQQNPELRFMSWLRVVTKRVTIDYVRTHPEYLDHRRSPDEDQVGEWVTPRTLPPDSRIGRRPPVTNQSTASELMRYAAATLPGPQVRALEMWLGGAAFEDIARELDQEEGKDAERLVRSALERLRRRFRDLEDQGGA